MSLTVVCDGCGQKLQAPENLLGKRVKCPKCTAPVQIPAPVEQDDLGDLLDDELALAPSEGTKSPVHEPARPQSKGPTCSHCGGELPADTRFCVGCGHNNADSDAMAGNLALAYDKRQQKLEKMSRPRHWLVSALFFWLR